MPGVLDLSLGGRVRQCDSLMSLCLPDCTRGVHVLYVLCTDEYPWLQPQTTHSATEDHGQDDHIRDQHTALQHHQGERECLDSGQIWSLCPMTYVGICIGWTVILWSLCITRESVTTVAPPITSVESGSLWSFLITQSFNFYALC